MRSRRSILTSAAWIWSRRGLQRSLGHAVTIWGINYDPNDVDNYLGVWITDSDDSRNMTNPSDKLCYYEVAFQAGNWYLQDYFGSDSWTIGVVQALDVRPDLYDLWQYGADPEVDASRLTYRIVGNTNPECGVSIEGNRYLQVSPEANWNGVSVVSIEVTDGEFAAADTLTITVKPVNDAPSFTKGADQVVLEDTGEQTVGGWATGISAGPGDESGKTLSFLVNNDNNTLFAVQPMIAADGTLTYTPAANANGSATVTVTLHDDGGTENGGAWPRERISRFQGVVLSVCVPGGGPA